jgi:predicted TPR repeat methyltransferase
MNSLLNPNKIKIGQLVKNKNSSIKIEALFQHALNAHKSGNVKYASDIYEHILSIQPRHVETIHALGILASKLQQWETAIAWMQQALSLQPNSARFHLHLANALKNNNQFELALTHYQTTLYLEPSYAEAHNNLAGLFYKQNKLNESRLHYLQAINLKPGYLEAHFNLGLVFFTQKEMKAAITQFKKVLSLDPNSLQAHSQLANIYWQIQNLKRSYYHYQKALDLEPNSAETLNNLAALMIKGGRSDKAIDYFNRALTIDPKHKTARNNLATLLLQTNQLKEAIWHYSLYLNLEPLDAEALFNRAHSLMLTGQLNEALDDLKKILAIDDKHINTHTNLAAIYLKLKNKARALAHYQTILNLTDKHAIASYMVNALTQQATPDGAPLEYIKNLFDNYAFQFDTHLQNILHYKTPELMHKLLKPFLKENNYNVLDLGCGTGLSGQCFIDIKKKLTGIDISPNMLNKAKEKACYDILIETDILHGITELQGEDFDLILCIDTLVYFGYLNLFFSKIPACLTENGLLGLSIELSDETISSYILQTNGRYQHGKTYVIELAKKNKLKLLKYKTIAGRQQDNEAVKTALFIFQQYKINH